MPSLSSLGAITFLGQVQNNFSLYSGAMQTVRELMDDSLAEEPLQKEKEDEGGAGDIQLPALSKSLLVRGVKFRYSSKLPDVIKDFTVSIGKGQYMVLYGSLGSR